MYTLEFLNKEQIEELFDQEAKDVIGYLLKKVLFSQPELIEGEKVGNIQMTKEFLESWVAQALGWKVIGAGNYPIDVYCPEKMIGADVKFLSAKVNKDGEFKNGTSNETSLSQKFTSTGVNLDQLFKEKKSKEILDGWVDILIDKIQKPIDEFNLDTIYYFIFIRGGDSINLAVTKVNISTIRNLSVSKLTDTSAFISGFINDEYGNVKIYKSKKRMELRCTPSNLERDNLLIKWDFSGLLKERKAMNLREAMKDKEKFAEYLKDNIDGLF